MFDNYIDKYGSKIYALCLKLCDRKESAAQDLYQDTWLRAYQSFNKYDTSKPFLPWITKVCVNLYRDRWRRNKLISFVERSTTQDHTTMLESIPDKLDCEHLNLEIQNALELLPNKLKICIILYYFFGYKVEETAQILNVPTGTVKSRLNKARKLLKKELYP